MTITSTGPAAPTSANAATATTAAAVPRHRRITVGVHGLSGCPAAVAWAADEGTRCASDLALLECVDGTALAWRRQPPEIRRATLRRLLRYAPPGTTPVLERAIGPIVPALLAASRRSDLLVLGREPDHDVNPLVVDVLARAPGPVAVVPRTWRVENLAPGAPVVVVLPAVRPNGTGVPARTLSYALVAARRRGTGVHVVAGWQPFATGADRAEVLKTFRRRDQLVLDAVRTVSATYPEVPVRVSVPVVDLDAELVRLSLRSRLLVVPRAGQVAVACIDRVECPLVVVP